MALQQIVEQTVIGLGYDLVEIERSSGGLLRITIDLPWQAPAEGAAPADEVYVTVEDCEKVTRQLQFALEVEAVEYQRLEVSSPGIDRPLRHEQDFVRFEGEVISRMPPHVVERHGIARTFQNIELFEHATVLHNLLIGRHTHRKTGFWSELFFTPATRAAELEAREKAEQVIDFLDLQHYRDTLVAGLPYGVRKVVEMARALCTEPKLLLLDEPSSGLNVEETDDMAFWIADIKNDLGITVLMVEHDMTLVSKVSDRVLAMNQGEVLAMGAPREVQTNPAVVEAYLGSIDDVASLRREAA